MAQTGRTNQRQRRRRPQERRRAAALAAIAALVIAATPATPATATARAHDTARIPSPVTTLYFAEGYTGPGFEEYLTIQNPTTATANVDITYQTGTGATINTSRQVAPNSRATVNVNSEVGPGQEVSAKIESDQVIFAERPMYFTYKGSVTGGHVASGQSQLAQTMYFAEGYTGLGFDEYITLQNPGGAPATVDIEYQLGTGPVINTQHVVAPTSRQTVNVNAEVGPGQEVSAKLTSDAPILAERPMYFTYHGSITDGHVSPAQSAAATTLYFAEGYTGAGFDEYITLQNPGSVAANVSIAYQSSSGTPFGNALVVPPHARSTVRVNNVVGANQEVSAKVTSDQPVLAERPMYFNYKGSVDGGSVVVGQSAPLTTGYFAEGYTGPGFDEYLTFQNPGGIDARVTVAYQFPGGATASTSLMVPANSRRTLAVGNDLGVGVDDSARVASDQPIVTERPMYFTYKGFADGGHVGAAQPGPPAAPEPYLSAASRIHHRGIGPIRAGMSITEAAQIGGFTYTLGMDFYGDGSCRYAAPTGWDIRFMLNYGVIVSTRVYGTSTSLTAEGLGIGNTGTQVIGTYSGRTHLNIKGEYPPWSIVQVDPVLPTNVGTSLVFHTENDVVRFIDSGFKVNAELYDGCL
ncbi:MAG: hypothetical protein DCC49_02235 [Acidobacteria bacterium]|nr:MAG: hypothetical protein DCC49_02235 [Acidobacteriota bacterium]